MPQCRYKGETFEKMNPVLIKSGIPDRPHWVKQLYKHDEDKIPLI